MATKKEKLLEEAQELGLDATDDNTVAELEEMIAEAKENEDQDAGDEPQEDAPEEDTQEPDAPEEDAPEPKKAEAKRAPEKLPDLPVMNTVPVVEYFHECLLGGYKDVALDHFEKMSKLFGNLQKKYAPERE